MQTLHGVEERISVSDSRAVLPKYCVMAYMESWVVGVRDWEGMAQGLQTPQACRASQKVP